MVAPSLWRVCSDIVLVPFGVAGMQNDARVGSEARAVTGIIEDGG
jgi:hypothetical protein